MNDKCKYCDYVSKCSRICEYDSYLCKVHRSFPKVVDKSYEQLQQENRKQKEVIDETINAIDLVIELIKQQPTKDDRWILDRLNGFKILLEYKEVSE